jgi:hypothetical protein
MKKLAIYLVLILLVCSCFNQEEKAKYQDKRENAISIEHKIKTIDFKYSFRHPFFCFLDDYLIVIGEVAKMSDRCIHLFSRNRFEYISSAVRYGRGPGEITEEGRVGVDRENKILWVCDHGKEVRWKIPLDSIIANPNFIPKENKKLFGDMFMTRMEFLNDSIALGKSVCFKPNNQFDFAMSRLNIRQNETSAFGYEHPEVEGSKTNSLFAMSLKDSLYVSAYVYCDLLTICKLDGSLKWNVYGKSWNKNKGNLKSYYDEIDIYKNYIICSYIGDTGVCIDKQGRPNGVLPTKFLVFDLEGNYILTLETNHPIKNFKVDELNKRMIVYFDDREKPISYTDLSFLDQL